MFTIPPSFIPNLHRIRRVRPPRLVERNRSRLSRVGVFAQLSVLDDTRRGDAQQRCEEECDLHSGWWDRLPVFEGGCFGGKEEGRLKSVLTQRVLTNSLFLTKSAPYFFFFFSILFWPIFRSLSCKASGTKSLGTVYWDLGWILGWFW